MKEEKPYSCDEHEAYRYEFKKLYFQAVAECGKIIKESNNIMIYNSEYYTDDDEESL